ncbi:MAG TPA: sigma 54-interacting transcriptional regulator [Bryobacteraceae bacterium]|nr:sigma 54-interacting transcriptional regulator [Bryobacteraceae bacterium]
MSLDFGQMTAQAAIPSRVVESRSQELPGARYESLIRLAGAIRAHRDPEKLFKILVRELGQVVQFDAIAQFDESANKVYWHLGQFCNHPAGESEGDLAKEETLAWWVHLHQQPLVIPSVDGETRFPRMMAKLREFGIQSICALPLTTVHRRLGSLLIASGSANAYAEDEVRFLSLMVNQIALAMDDAMNFQASQRAQERLELLLDLTNSVISNLDLRDLLRAIAASIRRVMQCDGVGVALPEPDSQRLRLYALDFPGGKGAIREGLLPPDDDRSAALVFRTGQPMRMDSQDLSSDQLALAEGVKSIFHLPLISRNRTLGVLTLGHLVEKTFSDEEVRFLTQIAKQVAIAVENSVAYGQIAELRDHLAQEKLYLEDEIRSELNFEEIIGKSDALRRVLAQVETVAPTDSTVLIYGETGTGKELIARAVHNLSTRGSNAFVKLNCAAIPTGLLESELFGHEKGAFTGAIAQRTGRFELAHRGTVFLDEIGEIPLEVQPKLLRVLQEREFERLGSSRTQRSDARLIAATNRDLSAMVELQKFRSDLYYRLNVFPIRVPALRERPEDIPLLVRHFVQQFSRRTNRNIETIPSEAMNALVRYSWPGNIRELQNVVERAVIVSTGPVLKVPVDDLVVRARAADAQAEEASPIDTARNMRGMLEDTERKQILGALEQTRWIVAGPNGAAKLLGMKRSTLQSRMQKLGIRISRSGN